MIGLLSVAGQRTTCFYTIMLIKVFNVERLGHEDRVMEPPAFGVADPVTAQQVVDMDRKY